MIKLQARMAIQAIKPLTDDGASHPSPWLNGPQTWLMDSEVGSDGWHCDDKRWQCYFARGGSEVNIHHMYVGKRLVFLLFCESERCVDFVLEKRNKDT